MSKYFEQQLITASLVTPTFPGSGARHVALFTADPLDDPTTNPYEVNSATATWYGRVACASWQAAQTSGTTHTTSNQAVVTYDPVTGDSLTVSHFGAEENSEEFAAAVDLGAPHALSMASKRVTSERPGETMKSVFTRSL